MWCYFCWGLFNISHFILISDLRCIRDRLCIRDIQQTRPLGISKYFTRAVIWMVPLFLCPPKPAQFTGSHFLSAHCLYLWLPVIFSYCIFFCGLSWWQRGDERMERCWDEEQDRNKRTEREMDRPSQDRTMWSSVSWTLKEFSCSTLPSPCNTHTRKQILHTGIPLGFKEKLFCLPVMIFTHIAVESTLTCTSNWHH